MFVIATKKSSTAENRTINRSWRLLTDSNGDIAINSGIAEKIAIARGEAFPTAPRAGQLFIKNNKLYRYDEE